MKRNQNAVNQTKTRFMPKTSLELYARTYMFYRKKNRKKIRSPRENCIFQNYETQSENKLWKSMQGR